MKDVFQFDARKHAYTLNGKPLMGCTTVLGVIAKPALVPWAARMAVEHIKSEFEDIIFPSKEGDGIEHVDCSYERFYEIIEEGRTAHSKKRDSAADAGSDLHALVEEYVKECIEKYDGLPAVDVNDLNTPIAAFIVWANKEQIRFIASEKRLYSKSLWVAGTCDLIFEKDGKRYVGDIKTYKKIWDRVPVIQCAGYSIMYEEMNETGKIDGYCIVCLPKEREFNPEEDVLWSWDTEGDREAFVSAVKLYKYLNQ